MKKVFIFMLIAAIVIGGFVLLKEHIVPTEEPSETTGSMSETTKQAPPSASTEKPDDNDNNGDENNETTTAGDNITTPEESTTSNEQETTEPNPPVNTGTTEAETTPDIPNESQPSNKEDEKPEYPDEDIVHDLSADIKSQDTPVGIAIYVSSDGTVPYMNGQKIIGSVSTDSFGNQIISFGEFKAVYISTNWNDSENANANVSDPYLVKANLKNLNYDDASIKVLEAHYYDQHIQAKTMYGGIVYLGESGLYLIVNEAAMKPGSTGGVFWMSQIGNDTIGCQILVNRDPKYIGDNITLTMFNNQGIASNKLEILAENITPGMVIDVSEHITEDVRLCSITTVDLGGTTRTIEGLFPEDLGKTKSIQCCIIKDGIVCYITLILQH